MWNKKKGEKERFNLDHFIYVKIKDSVKANLQVYERYVHIYVTVFSLFLTSLKYNE